MQASVESGGYKSLEIQGSVAVCLFICRGLAFSFMASYCIFLCDA